MATVAAIISSENDVGNATILFVNVVCRLFYLFLAEIPGDKHHFRCLACQKTNSCGHMGEADVKRHINSNHHQSCLRNESNSRSSQLKLTDNGSQVIIVYANLSMFGLVITMGVVIIRIGQLRAKLVNILLIETY